MFTSSKLRTNHSDTPRKISTDTVTWTQSQRSAHRFTTPKSRVPLQEYWCQRCQSTVKLMVSKNVTHKLQRNCSDLRKVA
uniref:Uncharacterized protein n=1 Tax=Physcomitrium patens TaxID=3218 RepID=A0A2K1L058_PHYPA|nr:hypothetical protein PHYPA_002205 [Physcomitrium patens]